MRSLTVLATLLPALALGACAPAATPVASDRAARDAAILRAVEPCERRFPAIRVLAVDEHGRVQAQASGTSIGDIAAFQQCAQEEVRRTLSASARDPGRLATMTGPAMVPIHPSGTTTLVPVQVNGVPGNLLLDTGATFSVLHPGYAERAGAVPVADAPRILGVVVGGRVVTIPFVRLQSLQVGEARVEGIEVGVYNALPNVRGVDGLLGGNFLNHFKLTLDRENRSLTLEPSRSAAASPSAATTASAAPVGREWLTPSWTTGDEWRLRWRSPTGGGSYVRWVVGEETVDGITHYVLSSGTRQLYYVKATLGRHFDKADGDVVLRLTPPFSYHWPLRVGKTWDVSYRRENPRTGQGQDLFRRCVVADEPTVTVPAGTFPTVHVVCRDRDGRVVDELWWAEETRYPVQERQVTPQGDRVTELVSYSVRRAP